MDHKLTIAIVYYPNNMKKSLQYIGCGYLTFSFDKKEFKLLQHGSLLMTVWQDTKVVSALATNSQPLAIIQVERKQQNGERKLVNCPQLFISITKKWVELIVMIN